jgi:diguanylate cyclase (GGDEF)-like protein
MEKFSNVLETSGRRLSLYVAAGFVMMFVLVASLVGHGLWQQSGLLDQIEKVLELRSRKIALATQLQLTAHKRQEMLLAQLLTKDAIERETLYGEYLEATEQFAKTDTLLKALPQDTADRDAFARLDSVVARTEELTEQALVLNAKGERERAVTLLQDKVQDLQQAHAEVLDGIRQHQQTLMNEQVRDTRRQAQQAMWVSAALGAGVCALIGMVFVAVRYLLAERAKSVSQKAREIEALSERLFQEATHDALTGLANRRMFFEQLELAYANTKRQGGNLALAYIDLDKFKHINDTLGHAVGDQLLFTVAARMQEVLREGDTLARLGGDEFAIVLQQADDEALKHLEKRLRETVSQPIVMQEHSITPAFSIGFARYPHDADSVQSLLHFADELMYRQKARRRETGSALIPVAAD